MTGGPAGGTSRTPAPVPWAILAGGAALLAAGLLAAGRWLPEWRGGPGERGGRVAKVQADLKASGGRVFAPILKVAAASSGEAYARAFRRLGPAAPAYLEKSGGAVWHRVAGTLEVTGAGLGAFEADLAADGSYRAFTWYPGGAFSIGLVDEGVKKAREAYYDRLESLLAAGSPLGPPETYVESNVPVVARPIEAPGGGVGESLLRIQLPNGVVLRRQVADPGGTLRNTADALVQKLVRSVVPLVLSVGLVLVLFGRLLYRRRLDFRLGLGLAALVVASATLTGPDPDGQPVLTAVRLGLHLVAVAYLVAQWAVAESLLRDTIPGFTTSLDTLAAGRLGPRAGRALLAGLGAGAAYEGLTLLAYSGAALAAPAVVPTRTSFGLPFCSLLGNPFYEGAANVSSLVLLVALFRSFLPRKWADPAGGLAAALFLSLATPFEPWGAALAASALACGAGLLVLQRLGLASLLAAAIAGPLFRDAFASGHLLTSNLSAFALSSGALAFLAVLGVAGSVRSPRDEEGRVAAPDYLKRLESERRVKYEMDLLSRMQLAMLPEKAPDVPGFRIAFRSVLATEAGGDLYEFQVDADGALWVAAGDVSGHGYSCGIQGAMVKAALLSLVKAGRAPAEVLGEIDRVLRAAGSHRLFTTLALVRIDPATGRGVFANAGHPFPLLVHEGTCRELPAPGLPLGQGPPRAYADQGFEIPPGGTLVLASDGLFEAVDPFDEPYGYDRPRAVLTSVGLWRRPADGILDALLADWSRHAGEGAPADDTTIVVLKRAG